MHLPELDTRITIFVGNMLRESGTVPAIFFAVDDKERIHILPAPRYPEKRGFYQVLLRAYFAVHQVKQYGFAAEAWMATYKKDPTTVDKDGRIRVLRDELPSVHPDRVECVVTAAVTTCEIMNRTWSIVREDGQPPQLGPEVLSGATPNKERAALFDLLGEVPDGKLDAVKEVLGLLNMDHTFPGHLILTKQEYDHVNF